ncbi:transcriptional regulator GlxA family with amidase domain [Sphingomonas leidyi]|uniref:Transcriptional regulator GlxA family with amidase domain n=1 Tax=Sphingomonas leidyi TaxID=68569 RepID=A0A7X5UYU7_9SPHN|nr:GlxA family transcriptional regulator [Sphingomonas leidyi]NIJ64216.1 transcriptional regulator GlxA family with amidase domain [Sphingomonas leidyi]
MLRVDFVTHPGFNVLSLSMLTVFEFANLAGETPAYEVRLVSEGGGPVRGSMGVVVETAAMDESACDTLIIAGATGIAVPSPALVGLLRRAPDRYRRVVATCTGAFLLAEAGLLDGRRATTHWLYARELANRFPKIKVEDDRIFIGDGPVWTSAGATAGIDLALALVEQDLGAEISRTIAKQMVVYHRRAGGQSQFSELLDLEPKSDRIQKALTYARRNLQTPLSVPQLAQAANLSPRQFSRAFQAETGQSPAKAVERIRVEAARLMMEQSRHPIEVVARETGFADRDRMRRAFLRTFGQPPQAIRRAATGDAIDIRSSTIEA